MSEHSDPYVPPPAPAGPPPKAPMPWYLKIVIGVAVIAGILVLGVVVIAGLVLATCALGR